MSSLRADRNIHTVCLQEQDAEELIIFSFGHVLSAIERKASLVDASVAIGRRIRAKLKLKRDSVAACHIGWFVLVSFIEQGLLEYELSHKITKRNKRSKFLTYSLRIKNKKALFDLWDQLSEEDKVDLFPMPSPPQNWVTGVHETGIPIVRKSVGAVIKQFKEGQQDYVKDSLNKLNSTAWIINTRVLEVFEWYFDNKTELTPFSHHHETNVDKKTSYFIEAEAIKRLAVKQKNCLFYHLYNTDFR